MNPGDREILDHFTRTRNKTIDLVRAVPEELWNRKAEGEELPTNKLFAHLTDAVDFWMNNSLKDGKEVASCRSLGKEDKESVLTALERSRDRLVRFFTADDGTKLDQAFAHPRTGETFTGRNRLLYLTQHESHHRGKLVLALRQWGFKAVPFLPY